MAPRPGSFDVQSRKLRNVVSHWMGDQKFIISCFERRVKSLVLAAFAIVSTHQYPHPHWARVVGYGTFSLCVIHKEGLCPSSGDINRLMMMMMMIE
jgi:hypothetical protein